MSAGAVDTKEATHGYDLFYNHKGKLFLVLGSLMVAMLLSALDQMIFSTAMPAIVGELDGVSSMLFITVAYILAVTISMPIYGSLSDVLGRKPLLLIGIAIFMVGSVVGGLAQDMPILIAGRAIQGAGGGGLMLLAQAVIADIVPLAKRGKYMGLLGATFGLSSVLGPLLGGWFTEGPGWRWAFWMNLPLGVIALAAVAIFLRTPFERIKAKFDIFGTLTMAISVTSLVLFTSWGGATYEWNSPIIIFLIAAFVAFVGLFVWAESKASEPIIPLKLFKKRSFTISVVAGMLIGIVMFGTLGFLPTYLQMTHALGATNSGLLLLPLMGGLIVASIISGQLMTKIKNYKILPISGFVLIGASLFLFSTMTPDTSLVMTSIYMTIMGLGIGSSLQILVQIVQQSVSHRYLGTATATSNFSREVGATLGGSIVGSLFTHKLVSILAEKLPSGSVADSNALTPDVVSGLPDTVRLVIVNAYNDSLTPVFAYLIPLVVVGLIMLFFIKQKPFIDNEASIGDEIIDAMIETAPVHTPTAAHDTRGVTPKYVKNKNGKIVLATSVFSISD